MTHKSHPKTTPHEQSEAEKVDAIKEGLATEKDKTLRCDEIEELQEKLQKAQEESAKFKEGLVYLRAEFENFKKRHLKEKEDFFKFSNERLLKQILIVSDHLENACVHAQSADKESLLLGVKMTLSELKNILKQNGVEEVTGTGAPFDPHYHEAISEEVSLTAKPGEVLSVHEKGYLYKDRLLRPAKVVVAAKPEEKK